MKHQLLLLTSVGLLVFFVLLNIPIPIGTPTGAAITNARETETYAVTLEHIIGDFYGTIDIQMPRGACTDIAAEILETFLAKDLHQTSGFRTSQRERLATINFALDRGVGTLDMLMGETLLAGKNADSMLSLNIDTFSRMPPGPVRMTYYIIDLYGSANGVFTVTHGSFSTPSLDCAFQSRNGIALCDCNAHSIQGIKDE